MTTIYDAIVIGAGTGGATVFTALNQAGLKVAVIERELVGGECAYWGCVPSKVLLRPADLLWQARHSPGIGAPSVDWPTVARYRDDLVLHLDDAGRVAEMRGWGIDVIRGRATITGAGTVEVNGQTLHTRRIIIATGSVPGIPPIPGLQEVGYWTNREATEMESIPRRVLVLGGGAVGCELGQAMRGLGAEVTIVESAERLLSQEPAGAAHYLQEQFREDGIALHLGHAVSRFERTHDGIQATLDTDETLIADVVLVATGRHPQTEGLGLEHVGISSSATGVPVDEYCRAAENVWAVGDVTGIAPFTHVADYQGEIVVADILGSPRKANYTAIPAVTFTTPEVASVGVCDAGAAPDDMEIITASVPLSAETRTATFGQHLNGDLCLLADKHARVLVGAWAVGPLATEWIQFATLAIRARIPLNTLHDTILAFPSFTRLYLSPLAELHRQSTPSA